MRITIELMIVGDYLDQNQIEQVITATDSLRRLALDISPTISLDVLLDGKVCWRAMESVMITRAVKKT